jgi:hypothetical protein
MTKFGVDHEITIHKVNVAGVEIYELAVNGITIGQSKNQFDADHAKIMLQKALESRVPPKAH